MPLPLPLRPNLLTSTSGSVSDQIFLGVRFSVASPDVWRDRLIAGPHDPFAYVVTPNVDHVVKISSDPEVAAVYEQAAWRPCDSRILDRLAGLRGLSLNPYPGSDMVADILKDPRSKPLTIGILGPSQDQFDRLAALYPDHLLSFIPAPMMRRGDAAWQTALSHAEAAQTDLLFLCISFPKQEFFAQALKARGHARGIALCVGASIDFLTGEQKRAPKMVQNLSLEWAWRLLSNPTRLWRRYLIEGPKIFRLWLRDRK